MSPENLFDRTAALEAAMSAALRATKHNHAGMRRGLNSLASIISTAPWVGVFGTMISLLHFGGADGNKDTMLAYVALHISESIVLSAAGLLIALAATALHRYLLARADALDDEVRAALLQLRSDLSRIALA